MMLRFTFALFLSGVSLLAHALPFSIYPSPGTTLPTSVLPGQTTTALYTVTNNTGSYRPNNYVKYLPPNVTQVTAGSGYTNVCGSTFNLNARGSAGDACNLLLNISGPVNAQDPDPHHHLFVCFPGGKACAGTNQALNVSSFTPALQTRGYVSQLIDGSIRLCGIEPLSGLLSNCNNASAAPFNGPALISFNSDASKIYVPQILGTTVFFCNVEGATGLLSNCTDAGVPGDPSTVFVSPVAIVLNNSNTIGYVSSQTDNRVFRCDVNSTGQISNCTQSDFNPISLGAPIGITLNHAGTYAYVGHGGPILPNEGIVLCHVNQVNGALELCTAGVDDGSENFAVAAQLRLNSAGTRAYISNNAGNTVSLCSVNLMTQKLQQCEDSGVGAIFTNPAGVAINAANTLLYVANNASSTVSVCTINPSTGNLITCQLSTGFITPAGVVLQ